MRKLRSLISRVPLPGTQHCSQIVQFHSWKGRDTPQFSLGKNCVKVANQRGVNKFPQAWGIVGHAISDAGEKTYLAGEVVIPK